MKAKKVYLIGAGPGRPDLITVRGLNIIKEADVIIHDCLVDKSLLEYAKPGAEIICRDRLEKGFLIKKAKEGKKTVRLKGGDPSIFGRSSEELRELLRNRIRFEVIPGITAASAASSLNGIPLTERGIASSCVFVTGREAPGKKKSLLNWEELSKCGTLVLYMAVGTLDDIVKKLLEVGKPKEAPVALIQDTSLITEKVIRASLKDIASKAKKAHVKPPAIVIIGEVVKLEKEFNRLRKGKKVLFTGLSKERFFEDKMYFHLPLIKIEPMKDYRDFDKFLKNIREFDWIVFASRYGAEYFFRRLRRVGYDSRTLANIQIAAVGNSTKSRLLDFGISADLVPKRESSKGLIDEFRKIAIKGKKIFLPRSDTADKGLGEALAGLGARVTGSFAYRNVMPEGLPDLDLNFFDEIMFTSPSTARNFKKRYGKTPKKVKIKCIGDATLKEAKKCALLT